MKPDFALNLSPDGLTLMYRVKRGWQIVGEASLDDPRLKTRLAEMRETAARLAPEGIRTKLILPESQVLNTSIPSPGPDDAARRAAVERALDGMTPYALDELCFDWEAEGEVLHIAVVARETMAEAEAFAIDHQLNPVSLVALPKGGSFTGEPFFGETAAAADILPKGERVKRDLRPTIPTGKLVDPVPDEAPVVQAAQDPVPETVKDDPPPVEVEATHEIAPEAADDAAAGPEPDNERPEAEKTSVAEGEETEKDQAEAAIDLSAAETSVEATPDEEADDPDADEALAAALGAPLTEPGITEPDRANAATAEDQDDHQTSGEVPAESDADASGSGGV